AAAQSSASDRDELLQFRHLLPGDLGNADLLIVGVASAVVASVVGTAVGLISGFAGGWLDEVMMRFNDVVLSIPWLVLMTVVAAKLGVIDLTGLILVIGLPGWAVPARAIPRLV